MEADVRHLDKEPLWYRPKGIPLWGCGRFAVCAFGMGKTTSCRITAQQVYVFHHCSGWIRTGLNIQKDYIAEQQSTLQDAKNVNKRLEAKLDKKDRAIRKANGCKWTNDGDGCPVLGEVDRLEDHYVTDCEHCKYHQEEKPESEEKQ